MKVTALIPDKLIHDVRSLTGGRTITDSIISALSEWSSSQRIKQLSERIRRKPLRFAPGYSARKIRAINRRP